MSVTDKKSGSEPNTMYIKSAIYIKCISCLILLQLNSSYAATPTEDADPESVKGKLLHLFRSEDVDSDSHVAKIKPNAANIQNTALAPESSVVVQKVPVVLIAGENAAAPNRSSEAKATLKPKMWFAKQQSVEKDDSLKNIEKPTISVVLKLPTTNQTKTDSQVKTEPQKTKAVWETLFPSQDSISPKTSTQSINASSAVNAPTAAKLPSPLKASKTVKTAIAAESTKTVAVIKNNTAVNTQTTAQKGLWTKLFPENENKTTSGKSGQNLPLNSAVQAMATSQSQSLGNNPSSLNLDSTALVTPQSLRQPHQQTVRAAVDQELQVTMVAAVKPLENANIALPMDELNKPVEESTTLHPLWHRLFPTTKTVKANGVPYSEMVDSNAVDVAATKLEEQPIPHSLAVDSSAAAASPALAQKTWWQRLLPRTNTLNSTPDQPPAIEADPSLAIRREVSTVHVKPITATPAVEPKPTFWTNLLPNAASKTQPVTSDSVTLEQPVSSAVLSMPDKPIKKSVWKVLFPSRNDLAQTATTPASALTLQTETSSNVAKVQANQNAVDAAHNQTIPAESVSLGALPPTTVVQPSGKKKTLWRTLFPTTPAETGTSLVDVHSKSVSTAPGIAETQLVQNPALNKSERILPVVPSQAASREMQQSFSLAEAQAKAVPNKVKAAQQDFATQTPAISSPSRVPTKTADMASTATVSVAGNNDENESVDYTILQANKNQTWNVAAKPVAKTPITQRQENIYNNWMVEPRPSFGQRVWNGTKNISSLLGPQSDDNFRYLDIQKLSNFNVEQTSQDPVVASPSQPYANNSNIAVTDSPLVSSTQAILMQPRLSLADAVRIAVVRHPQITQSISRLAAQNSNIDIAKSQYYPQLSTGIATGDLTSSERGRQQLSLNLQQALFDFGKIKTNVNTEQAKLQVEQANVLLNIDDIAFKVASAIVNIKRYQKISEIAKQQVEGTQRILDIANLRAQAGISSQADPVQAQTYLESARANLLTQQSLVRENQQRLRTLLSIDLSRKDFELPDDLVEISDLYKEPEFNKIPSMIVAQSQVEVAKSQLKQTELSRYPTLSVRGSLSQSINGRNTDNNLNNSTSSAILLEASSNFYQGGLNSSQVKSASFAEQAAKAEVNSVYLDVLDKIRTYREQIENKQAQIKVLVDRQQSTTRTRELYQEQYKLGTRTVLDLLNAEQAIHASNSELQNARYDIYTNLIQYIATTGRSREVYDLNSLTIQGVDIQP